MLSVMSTGRAAKLAADLKARRQRLDHEELRWSIDAARLAESGYHEQMGSATASDLLRHECHMGEGAVRDRLAIGRRLDQLHHTATAMCEGKVGFGHLVVMAHTARSAG